MVLLGELVCSFTLQSASCCHQDELNIRLLHGGAFLQNATSCSGAVEVGCAHPHSHVWNFQLEVVLLQHFSVEKLPAGLYHRGWRPKDLRSFSCHRGITWCGGSIRREEGFSIYQSLLMFLEEKEGLGEGAALWHVPWVLCSLTKLCDQTD